MTLDDWQQAQEADPVLGIIIKRLREGMLEQDWCKKTGSPELNQYKRGVEQFGNTKGYLVQASQA